jgi:hypothetical protein
MTGTEIYKRTPIYDREALSIRLHAPQWKLLLAFDGQRSLAEVALSADVSFAEALPLTEKYLTHGWIEEQPITLDQYLKRTGAPNVSAIGASIPPAVVLHHPRPHLPPLPPPAKTPAPMILAASPQTAPPSARGGMRLSAVVDFIVSTAGSSSLGNLLVYRVFLQVPPELLQAEDIVSVHLANDTSVIKTRPLQQAIMAAVNEIVKRPLPDSVFAAA